MTSPPSHDPSHDPLPEHPQRQPQAQALSADAHAWLAGLPPRYQPLATARRHPHIVNQLCELWATPAVLPAYMRELVLSSRPAQREGFAFEVLTELADLQALVDEMQQAKR
jgi:hypothetical protein